MRARWLVAPLLFCAVASCRHEETESYAGTVELEDVRIGSLVGGRVAHTLAVEGDRVAQGQPLIRLDTREWDATLAEAEAQADAAARRLALLEAGTRREQIAQARAEQERQKLLFEVIKQGSRSQEIEEARKRVEGARAAAQFAERELRRVSDLVQAAAASQQEMDRATTAVREAQAGVAALEQRRGLLEAGFRPEEVAAAEAAWKKASAYVAELEAGPRPEEIAAARAEHEAALAHVRFLETRIAELTISSPADAIVQTLDLRPGDLLAQGATAAVLLLPRECRITVYLPEDRLGRVSLGQRARVTFDGLAETWEGQVDWISREAEFTPRNVQTRSERVTQVFAVRVRLEGDVSKLKDGLWGDVVFP